MATNQGSIVFHLQPVFPPPQEERQCFLDVGDLTLFPSPFILLLGPLAEIVGVGLRIRVVVQTESTVERETKQMVEGCPKSSLLLFQRGQGGTNLQETTSVAID